MQVKDNFFTDIYFDTAADNLDFKWQHQYW